MKHLYLIISVLLFLCLLPMPYGYYTLVRFVAMVAFGVLAYNYNMQNKGTLTVTFASLAILFQPFFKIALGRMMWNIVDVAVAVLLLILWFKERYEP